MTEEFDNFATSTVIGSAENSAEQTVLNVTPQQNGAPSQNQCETVFDAEKLFNSVGDACYVLDRDWRFVYINHAAEKLVQRMRAELLGKSVWDEFPEAVGSSFDLQYRRAIADGVPTSTEEYYPPLDTWFSVRAFPYDGGVAVLFQDVDELKRAERKAQERTAAILESITDAFFSLDSDWCFTYINDQSERLMNRKRDELLGHSFLDEFPEIAGSAFERHYRRAIDEHITITFEDYYSPLGLWVEVRAYPSEVGGLSVFYRDINERRKSQEILERSREDLQLAVDGAQLGTFYCDWPLDKIIWNHTCKEHFFLPPDAEVDFGLFYSLLHPDDRETTRRAIEQAQAEHVEYSVEYRTLAPDGRSRWINAVGRFYYSDDGTPIRFDGITIDISARKAAEEALHRRVDRERFLADLAERAQRLADPADVIADAVHSIGQFLEVSRCVFVDVNTASYICHPDYRANELISSMAGTWPISAFGSIINPEYASTVAVDDVYDDPIKVPSEHIPPFDALSIRAYVTVPVVHSDQLVACVFIHSSIARTWEPEEVQLVVLATERTWLTIAVLRQQQALAIGIAKQRERAEREALLNRIGQALRSSPDAQQVLTIAMREIGEALGADRCYYAAYDVDTDTATIGVDWHRPNLPSLAGQYRMSDFAINSEAGYRAGRTQIVIDSSEDHAAQALGLTALVRVPLVSGRAMTAMSAAMSNGPRVWSEAEVSLLESVATLTKTALQSVRVHEREHRIAQQLQDALQPALPAKVLGLSLGHRSQPALDEAQVGGDFYDVFALDQGLYAVVIGDVSGKGLAAAQQLALIRNMLRAMLYRIQAPAEAAKAVNEIVSVHDLLVGFVTCWVGVYDASTGVIRYCCCGHEPPLVRRANGRVEALTECGPPLGIDEHSQFTEAAMILGSGDTLLLYTDGVSEAGMDRRNALGVSGLKSLFSALPQEYGVQNEAERLVEELRRYAGAFRDDIAVVLCRRE